MEESKHESLFAGLVNNYMDQFDESYNEILIDYLTTIKPSCPELSEYADSELASSFGG